MEKTIQVGDSMPLHVFEEMDYIHLALWVCICTYNENIKITSSLLWTNAAWIHTIDWIISIYVSKSYSALQTGSYKKYTTINIAFGGVHLLSSFVISFQTYIYTQTQCAVEITENKPTNINKPYK